MGWKVTERIWKRRGLSHTQMLLLAALALHADDLGYCWPGQERLADMCGLSVRQIRRLLVQLEATGDLFIGRRGRGRAYLVLTGITGEEREVAMNRYFAVRRPAGNVARPATTMSGVEGVSTGDVRSRPDISLHVDLPVLSVSMSGESESTDETIGDDVSVSASSQTPDYQRAWERVLEGLAGKMSRHTFDQNLRGSACLGPNGSPDHWRVRVRNLGSPDWLTSPQMAPLVGRIIERELGEGIRVTFEAGT